MPKSIGVEIDARCVLYRYPFEKEYTQKSSIGLRHFVLEEPLKVVEFEYGGRRKAFFRATEARTLTPAVVPADVVLKHGPIQRQLAKRKVSFVSLNEP